MTRILLALDGSDASHAAAAAAQRLFGTTAEYLAVNVYDAPSAMVPTLTDPLVWGAVWRYDVLAATEADSESAREIATDEARDEAALVGIEPVESIGSVGDPAEAIIAAATEHAVDAIVVGSHQRGWISRLFDPPVADDLVARSNVPVLVVRQTD